MDTCTWVKNRIGNGEIYLTQLAATGFDVTAACWVKSSEEERWFLYVVTKTIDEKGRSVAYQEAYGVVLQMDIPWISMSETKLIAPTHPIAGAVIASMRRHPGRSVTWTRYTNLGDLATDEGYIYPAVPSGRSDSSAKRKTRIVGRRQDTSNGTPRVIEEEIGVLEGEIGEEAFNKAYVQLINEKFGSLQAFAALHRNGYVQFQFLDRSNTE